MTPHSYRELRSKKPFLLPPALTGEHAVALIKDKNIGKDGVKLVAYTPIAGALGYPDMGEFGPGVHGWYVVAGGFGRHMSAILSAAYNVSVTKPISLKDGTPIRSVEDFRS